MPRLSRIYSSQLVLERLQVRIAWLISYFWFFVLLVLQLIISGLVVTLLSIDSWNNGSLLPFLLALPLLFLYNLPLLHVWHRLRAFYRAATDISKLEELPSSVSDLVLQRTNALKARMSPQYRAKLECSSIRLLFEPRNFKPTPSMIATSRNINLIFPLGFFKVMKADPDAADAMIAHELAHYLHEDSGLLLQVKCYLKAAVVTFYYHSIMFVLVFAFALLSNFQISYHQKAPIEKELEKIEKAEREYIRDHRTWPPPESLARLFANDKARLESELRIVRAQQWATLRNSGSYLLVFLYFGLLLLYLRRRVHRSEELADLFACLLTHPKAVASFLSEMGPDNYNLGSLHPQITKRIKLAKKYEAAV